MNTKILQKCLDELNKPTPDVSYLKGMVEALLDLGSGQTTVTSTHTGLLGAIPIPKTNPVEYETLIDEGASLDAMARASIETIKKLNNENES